MLRLRSPEASTVQRPFLQIRAGRSGTGLEEVKVAERTEPILEGKTRQTIHTILSPHRLVAIDRLEAQHCLEGTEVPRSEDVYMNIL